MCDSRRSIPSLYLTQDRLAMSMLTGEVYRFLFRLAVMNKVCTLLDHEGVPHYA